MGDDGWRQTGGLLEALSAPNEWPITYDAGDDADQRIAAMYPGPRFHVPEKPAQAAADEEPQTRYAILSEHDAIVLLVQLRNRYGSASAMYDALQKAGVVLARERVE